MTSLQPRLAIIVLTLLVSACGGGSRGPRISDVPLSKQSSADPHVCLSWGGEAALVCNETMLQSSFENHELTTPWRSLKLSTPGNHGPIATAPGIAQVLLENGWPFEPGGKLVLEGSAPTGTILLVNGRDRSHGERHWWVGQALFRDLGLAAGGTAVLTVSSNDRGLVYELRRPDGSTVQPDLIWFHRS